MYPTLEHVNSASHEQICRWNRFLPGPYDNEQVVIMRRIVERLEDLGGFTPEISKLIGW